MKTFLFLLLASSPVFSNQSPEQKTEELQNTLENARAVPYFDQTDAGKVEKYLILDPSQGEQDFSSKRLRQGDVLTTPNETDEESP